MSTTILALHTIDVKGFKQFVKQKQREAETYAKIADALASIPGAGAIKDQIKKELKKAVDKAKDESKDYIVQVAKNMLMNELLKTQPPEEQIKKLNEVITEINKIIDQINNILQFLKVLIGLIFPIIIVLTVAFVVAKVITMIPSFGGGFGAVVVATFPGQVAQSVMTTCEKLLKDLKPLPMAILGFILSLLSVYNMVAALFNMMAGFLNNQLALLYASQAAANKSADDWDNTGTETDPDLLIGKPDNADTNIDDGISDGKDIGKTLRDNLLERITIDKQINDIDNRLAGNGMTGENIGDCHLPTGEIIKMTPEDCAAAGGIFGYGSPPTNPPSPPSSPYTDALGNVWCWNEPPGEWVCCGGPCGPPYTPDVSSASDRNNLLLLRNGLQNELDRLGGKLSASDLNNLPSDLIDQIGQVVDAVGSDIITSLLYPDPDITVETATQNFGVRYGFYQQEINEDEEK